MQDLKPCEIRIDAEGEWYHRGNRIIRREILELLYEKLDRLPGGEFVLAEGPEHCVLDVADVPFVISRVDLETKNGKERIALRLKHLSRRETLDPKTLRVGKDNVLYCRVRGGRFTARFSRPAYYQMAEFVKEAPGEEYYIELNGVRYPLTASE